jgi:hypothetical protein
MVVRQENVTHCTKRDIGEHQLSCNAVAAIDDIRGVVADDDLRGRRTRLPWPRSAACSEKDQSGRRGLRFTGGCE